MFNFTTLTIYNTIDSTPDSPNRNLWVPSDSTLKPSLRIGNTRFDADLIESIQVKNPTVENLASVEFDMQKIADLVKDETDPNDPTTITEKAPDMVTARIVLYIGLSMNCQDAFYANAFIYKGKPLTIEFYAKNGETKATIAQRVEKIAKKYLLLTLGEDKILNISNANGKVKFTAVNGYQIIKKAVLQWYNPEATTVDCCTMQGDYQDLITGVPVIYTTNTGGQVTVQNKKVDEDGKTAINLSDSEVAIAPGIEAFGDYNWIIHNLRLPTAANTNFWAVTKNEMPIPGQVYTQFIITMCKDRDGIAGGILGQRATTVTTHVLYVAGKISNGAGAAFEVNSALSNLLGDDADTKIKHDADDRLRIPFALL